MFNLELKFNALVEKYDIITQTENCYNEDEMYEAYEQKLMAFFHSLNPNDRVGIYGLGKNGENVFKIIGWENKYNIVCLIDNDTNKRERFAHKLEKLNIPIVESYEIINYNVNKILITHLNSRKEIKKHVNELYPHIEVIDIYEALEIDGIIYERPYWDYTYFALRYYLLKNQMVYDYKICGDLAEKKELLKKIISIHLKLRDFYNAELFIKDYIFLGFSGSEAYVAFEQELKELFNDARKEIQNKNNKSYLFFVVDSMTWEDADNMEYLSSIRNERGFSFEKAYSTSAWTHTSIRSVFTEKEPLRESVFNKPIEINNCPSLKKLLDKGYKLKMMGTSAGYIDYNKIIDIDETDKRKSIEKTYKTSSYLYWKFLCNHIEEEQDNIFFIHTLAELHTPFINSIYRHEFRIFPTFAQFMSEGPYGFLDKYDEEGVNSLKLRLSQQLKDSAEYLDKQIQFYFSFINLKKDTVVVMGDHGKEIERWWEEALNKKNTGKHINLNPSKKRINPAFIIFDNKLGYGKVNTIFSYIDIMKLIYSFSEGDYNVSVFKRPYAVAEEIPIYYKPLLFLYTHFNVGSEKYGYTAIYTETEKYVHYLNGEEKYFILPNEFEDKDNLINISDFTDRINFFRKIRTPISFEDIVKVMDSTSFSNALPFYDITDEKKLIVENFIKKEPETLLQYKLQRKE